MTMPAANTTTSATTWRADHRSGSAPGFSGSDAVGRPVPLGGAIDGAELRDGSSVLANGLGHGLRPVEQPVDLALVQVDAHDLALELVGDVGVLGRDAHVRREGDGRVVATEILEAPEVAPPRVREVLVELDDPAVVRPGHHPAPALLEHADAGIATQPVVDVPAHPEREVDLLRLEPGDLLAKELEWTLVVLARLAQQLLV